jgi:hypothetical protein
VAFSSYLLSPSCSGSPFKFLIRILLRGTSASSDCREITECCSWGLDNKDAATDDAGELDLEEGPALSKSKFEVVLANFLPLLGEGEPY